MEPEEKRALDLIRTAIRIEWTPIIYSFVQSIAAAQHADWSDACDTAELTLVSMSEELKLETPSLLPDDQGRVSLELAIQAFLQIIAELREQGPPNA